MTPSLSTLEALDRRAERLYLLTTRLDRASPVLLRALVPATLLTPFGMDRWPWSCLLTLLSLALGYVACELARPVCYARWRAARLLRARYLAGQSGQAAQAPAVVTPAAPDLVA